FTSDSHNIFSVSIFLFVEHSCAHRDLHSFPTRRSSDLEGVPVNNRHNRSASRLLFTGGAGSRFLDIVPGRVSYGAAFPGGKMSRSEEHTSELQSHLNLVCRLLLEKKKINKRRQ